MGIDLQVIESSEWLDEIIVENHLLLPRLRVDLDQLASALVAVSVGDDVQGVVVNDAPMRIVSWRIGSDPSQLIGVNVEQVLPRMRSIVTTRRTPLDEK
jgi:hypothetical protein